MISKEDMNILSYDTAYFLDDENLIVEYLNDAMKEGNEEFMQALDTVSRSLGMTELAKRTGLSRESLYKTLNGKTKPRYDSIQKILAGLNIKMQLVLAK